MALFRRRKPLHERLAEAGEIELARLDSGGRLGQIAQPPGWDGEPRGEPGIHGVPRARRWDAVASAEAPLLRGDVVHFVALEGGTLIVEEDEPDDSLGPLADAVEETLQPPYRAEAIRKAAETWAVAASRIDVARLPGLHGDEVELVATPEGRALHVDGRPTFGSVPGLERLGEAHGGEFVVRASRLEDDLWEVRTSPL